MGYQHESDVIVYFYHLFKSYLLILTKIWAQFPCRNAHRIRLANNWLNTVYLNRVAHCVYLFPASKKLQFLIISIEFFMAGNHSKAVVVMIRGLAKSSISNVEVPGSNLTEGTFFSFVLFFSYFVSFQNKTKHGNCLS